MSMYGYGSNPKLTNLGPRSNSRQDLLVGGNGFPTEFQQMEPGYGYQTATSFSRSSMHGGGGGGIKTMQSQSTFGGGGGGGQR